MNIKEKLETFVNSHLENSPHFLVEIEQKGTDRFPRLFLYVDGDQGIDIDSCAKITRAVTSYIEEENVIVTEYGIDVSSPGLDRPLVNHRQFLANKGRTLRVWLNEEDKKIEGVLSQVSELSIDLEISKGKKETEIVSIPFESIDKAKVLISI